MRDLACLCHSRDVLIRREPRSNPERRSAESVFALQIQPSRRSGLISLLRFARPNIPTGSNVRPAVLPKPVDVGCTRCARGERVHRVLLHGTGTPTADELARVNNHRPSIFSASPSRFTWLLAVQNGWPVAGFNDTSK